MDAGRRRPPVPRDGPSLGRLPTITDAAASEANYWTGIRQSMHQCRSQGEDLTVHSRCAQPSRREVHLDEECRIQPHRRAMRGGLGIAVENVAYSPDSVADYTLMLMLMAVRHAKSILSRVQAHDYRLNEVGGRELRDMTIGVIGMGRSVHPFWIDCMASVAGFWRMTVVPKRPPTTYLSMT